MWLTTSSLVLYQPAFANFLGCKTSLTLSITSLGKLRFVLQLDLGMAKKTVLLERRTKDLLKNVLLMMQSHMIVGNPTVIAVLLHLLQQNQNQNQNQPQNQRDHLFTTNHHHLLGSLLVRITSDLRRRLNRLLCLHHHHLPTKSLLSLALLLLPHHLFTKSPQRINIEVHRPLLTKFLL